MAIVFGCSTPISIRPLRDMIDSQVIHYDLETKPLIICLCTNFAGNSPKHERRPHVTVPTVHLGAKNDAENPIMLDS